MNDTSEDRDVKLTIATIQTDRKLLQDNIAMRVRYGWAFIALIVSLLMLISVPQDSQVDFQPKETYLLSVICLVTSIVLILMGLFSSHYGSSYKLFTNHGPIDDFDVLCTEQELHKKALYKNQLSSLYNGQSIMVAFVGVMVLLIASPVNVLSDPILVTLSMGCMFFSGMFLKKRMYRMYQIDENRLPGRGRSSILGHLGHMNLKFILDKCKWLHNKMSDTSSFINDGRVIEMSYGIVVIFFAYLIQTLLVILGAIIPFDALKIVSMIFFAAIAGFCAKHVYMVVMANLDPTKLDYNTASWNPLYWMMTGFRIGILGILIASVLLIYKVNLDTNYTLFFATTILFIMMILYYFALWYNRDYLNILKLDSLDENPKASLTTKTSFKVDFDFQVENRTLNVSVNNNDVGRKERWILRFAIEHLIFYPSKYEKIKINFPKKLKNEFKYTRGRGDLDVECDYVKNKLDTTEQNNNTSKQSHEESTP